MLPTKASAMPSPSPSPLPSPFRPRPEPASGDLHLSALPTAVGRARTFAREQVRRWRLEEPTGYDLPGTTDLITSELVTNAVKATGHAEMPAALLRDLRPALIVMRLRRADHSLFVEVWDQDPRPPIAKDADLLDESGRGLTLVTALCKAWDYYPSDSPAGGKVVWAELTIPAELA